jgi:hypothetical protein
MSEILRKLRVDGSIRDLIEFEAFMNKCSGVKAEHWGERFNAIGVPTVPDIAMITGSVSAVIAALAAYRKATKKKVSFYKSGQLKSAENYPPDELKGIMTRVERIELSEPQSDIPEKHLKGFAEGQPGFGEPN